MNAAAACVRSLVFSDVENSTEQVARLGATSAAELWTAHDRRARDLLAEHGGLEIARSDGIFAMFEDPARAARYALDYQAAMRALGLASRIGLHVGEVTVRRNAPDDVARGAPAWEVAGLAVSVTARLMSLARGGQTLLSGDARAMIERDVPDPARVQRHGFYRIKGLAAPIEVFELGAPGSAPFQPPPDADKAYRVVRESELWLPVAEIRHNLPAELDTFVGREHELRLLAERLSGDARLVTLIGPGGAGKTRLSRRYARTWLGDWRGGVYFCDLSEARTLDHVVRAVASALSVPLGGGDALAQLGHAIAGRGHSLVILDNFEQVVEHAGATVGRWLDSAPQARFLVTSRERLHLAGEAAIPLEPLPVEGDAIELFAHRARAQDPAFQVTDANRGAIVEIARFLDGLPLAIELAAARVRLLTPDELARRLQDRFRTLASRRASGRHATLRSAIDWSWDLLHERERAALEQAAVFEGDFTIEAAEHVLDAGPPPAVMDVLQALLDKSLLRPAQLRPSATSVAIPALGMYLSIRDYAIEKLAARGDAARIVAEQRHGAFYARLGSDDALAAASSRGGEALRSTLLASRDNVMAACVRAAARGDATCAVATFAAAWAVLELQGPASHAIALGEGVLAMDTLRDGERLRAQVLQAAVLRRCGDTDGSRRAAEQALELSEALGDRALGARAVLVLGMLCADEGRMDDAFSELERSLRLAQEARDRDAQARALNALAICAGQVGRYVDARTHLDAALECNRSTGNRRNEAAALANLANVLRMEGRGSEAIEAFHRALAEAGEVGDHRVVGIATGNLGTLYGDAGRLDEAIEYCDRAIAIHRDVGNPYGEGTIGATAARFVAGAGRFDEARARFDAAEQLLKAVGDNAALLDLFCDRAACEIDALDVKAARRALGDAEDLARRVAQPHGRSHDRIAALKARLPT